ncbi:hypothetical protein Tco_1253291 [Tanacetum coccineum]
MLAPSGGGLILYQAYGNLYAMTGRKAHLLEDKQIPSVGVFDEVFSTWMDFGGNTLAGDGVAGIKRRCRYLSSDKVRNFATALGRGRLKEDLESSSFSSSVTMATRSVWMSTSMGITASVPQTRLKGVSSGFPLALFDVPRVRLRDRSPNKSCEVVAQLIPCVSQHEWFSGELGIIVGDDCVRHAKSSDDLDVFAHVFEAERSKDVRIHSYEDLSNRERAKPASNALYSASLLAASKSNLKAYLKSCLDGFLSTNPALELSLLDALSISHIYLGEEACHDLPLDDCLDPKVILYSLSSIAHFDIFPAYSWFDKTCFSGLSVMTCIE